MKTFSNTIVTVETTVNIPITDLWNYWTLPEHIIQWYHASDDWHAPFAENDLRVDGKFRTTMAAKDGSFQFDFEGVYTRVDPRQRIEYVIADGRKVNIFFSSQGNRTHITESFETEEINSVEQQRDGWQAILDNFKKYAEQAWKHSE
jgi:uncharacterized protein YndB with AHSA1/START domain